MPGRVNTKFVLILVTSITTLVVLLVGIYWFQIRRNPEMHLRAADVYMQEGEYDRAIESYRRAAARAQNDVKYWDKLQDALEVVPTEFQANAERYFRLMISASRQKSDIAVNDPARQEAYYQLLCDLAAELNYPWLYQQLYTDTNTRLDAQPDNVLARKYRGIARVHLLTDRGDQFDRPRAEQQAAYDDLIAALDRWPDDADALHHLALWTLFDARYTRQTSGPQEDIERRRAEALSLSQRMIALDDDDPDLMLRHARVCLVVAEDIARDDRPDTPRTEALHEEAAQLVTRLEQTLTRSDFNQPDAVRLVLNTAGLLQLTDTEPVTLDSGTQTRRGVDRALKLYTAALARQPDTVDYLVQQGVLMMMVGRQDEALAAFEQARNPGRSMPAVELLRTQNQQIIAAVQIGNLLISRIAESDDPARKKQLTERVEGMVREIEPVYGRIPVLDLLEGKLKLTQGELAASLQLFDKAARATGESDFEAMRLAASVARQLGDWGDAARRLETLLIRNPTNLQSRLELTEIYLNGGRLEQAKAHLDLLTAQHPDHPIVQMLQANYLATSGDLDKAIAIYESQDPTSNPNVDTILARLYLLAQRPDDARRLVARRFEQNPKDVQTMSMLLRLTPDEAQRQAYVEQARAAGVEDGVLTIVQRQLSEQPITAEELETLLPQVENDPFRLALTQARRLMLTGDAEGAEKKLAEAAALKPDDKTLTETRFGLALQRQDWNLAQRLADRAKALNMDLAGGAFFRAQLAAAQNKLQEAAAEYESALNQRPIFSDGWRMLGDVYAKLNRVQPALDAYRRALEQQPNDPTTLDHLSRIEVQAQLTGEALRHARDAWRFAPNNRQLMERYIEMERAFGDPAAALKLREQLATNQPDNADNRRSLVRLMHEQGQKQEAMTMLDALIESEGATRPNVATKAALLLQEGRGDDGERTIQTYLTGLGEKAASADHAMLAQYRMQRGDLNGAVEAYNAARRVDDSPNMLFTRMLGDELFLHGAHDQAAPLYRQVLEKSPDDLGVRLRLAETLFRMNQLDETRELLRGLEPTEPKDRATLFVLRSILALPPDQNPDAPENAEAKAEALRLANLAIQQDESNPTAYTRRAVLLAGDAQRAAGVISDLNRALELNPGLTEARVMLVELHLRRNDVNEAMRELRQLLEQQPGNRDARMMLVNLYLNTGDRLSANRLVDDAMKLEPSNPFWPGVRARLASVAGDQAEAMRQLKKQMELAPAPNTVGQYALSLLANKQAGEALNLLRDHAGIVNSDRVLQAIRARALAMDGQTAPAEQLFVNTIASAGSMGEVTSIIAQMLTVMNASAAMAVVERVGEVSQPLWLEVARGHLLVRGRQFEEAISTLAPLRDRLPTDAPTRAIYLQELAQAYHMAGRIKEARGVYEELLTYTPNDAGTLNNLAYLLIDELNEPAEGLKMAERAAAAMPDNAAVLDTLGWAQYKTGKLDEARRTLENSVNRQPLAASCLHLARVYIDLSLGNRGREMLMRAIELADESQDQTTRDEAQRMLDSLDAASAP